MPLILLSDIDNTICDSKEQIDIIAKKYSLDDMGLWQKEHIAEFTKEAYIKSYDLITGAEILPQLARTLGAKLIFLTGRSSAAREATEIWLKFKLGVFDTVPLIMREDGDMSGPVECKINMFKNTVLKMYPLGHFIFLDDDEKLLMEYAKYGLALRAPDCWRNIVFNLENK